MSEAYLNSFKLLVGETTYDKLAEKNDGVFLLPVDHTDPDVTLKYFEEIEDYDKCIKIRDRQR